MLKTSVNSEATYRIEDDLNHQTAAGANSDIFAVAQVADTDFEPVAAGTWVVVDL